MRALGVETVINSDQLAIMGIVEVARVFPRFLHAFRELKQAALTKQPDAVILVDWPEFNLRLAHALHRNGLKIIYYISPQLWAWRPRRLKNVRRDIDLLLSILPFEAEWYEERGVEHVEFVGHPLAGEVRAHKTRTQFCLQHNLDPDQPLVSFLPGSRHKELQRILPPMLDAIEQLRKLRPDVQSLVAVAPSRSIEETQAIINAHSSIRSLPLIHGDTRDALAASNAAAVASGTATLEAALLETPMVIVYRESPINWHTLGRLITVEHFGLVNLVAGERIVTELMQDDLTGESLTAELLKLLDEADALAMKEKLRDVAHRLGDSGASQRAAQAVMKAVEEWKN
jgi:lipid-A-disaccharide synthase